MAQNQLVQVCVDGEITSQAAAVLAKIGLTVSDAVRILLTRAAKKMMANETAMAALEEAEKGGLKRFDPVEALMTDLNAED